MTVRAGHYSLGPLTRGGYGYDNGSGTGAEEGLVGN